MKHLFKTAKEYKALLDKNCPDCVGGVNGGGNCGCTTCKGSGKAKKQVRTGYCKNNVCNLNMFDFCRCD